jgi:hypothetical protein
VSIARRGLAKKGVGAETRVAQMTQTRNTRSAFISLGLYGMRGRPNRVRSGTNGRSSPGVVEWRVFETRFAECFKSRIHVYAALVGGGRTE